MGVSKFYKKQGDIAVTNYKRKGSGNCECWSNWFGLNGPNTLQNAK